VLTVTEAAAAKLKDLIAREGAEGQALRVRVRGGGCSGYEYQLAFDTPQEGDEVIEQRGVKVLVDPKSLLFLTGTEIDFEDGLTGAGLRVKHSLMNVALSGDRKEFGSPHSAGPWLKPTLLLESYALTGGGAAWYR